MDYYEKKKAEEEAEDKRRKREVGIMLLEDELRIHSSINDKLAIAKRLAALKNEATNPSPQHRHDLER